MTVVVTNETEENNDKVTECEKVETEEVSLENENDEQLGEKADVKENDEHNVAENEEDKNEKESNSADNVTVCQEGPISTPEIIPEKSVSGGTIY